MVLAEPAGDQRAVGAERQLPRNVEQAAKLDGRHIGGDRRGGFGQGDAELGEAIGDPVGHRAGKHRSGDQVNPIRTAVPHRIKIARS